MTWFIEVNTITRGKIVLRSIVSIDCITSVSEIPEGEEDYNTLIALDAHNHIAAIDKFDDVVEKIAAAQAY